MEIRKLASKNIETVVELWYNTSIIAHNFISEDYWKKNKEAMASKYLPIRILIWLLKTRK